MIELYDFEQVNQKFTSKNDVLRIQRLILKFSEPLS